MLGWRYGVLGSTTKPLVRADLVACGIGVDMKKLLTAVPALAMLLAVAVPSTSAPTALPASASTPRALSPAAIAKLAPAGTNPSTPRANWDQCVPTSLTYLAGVSYDVKNIGFQWIPQNELGPPAIFVPASAYVACTVSGPLTAVSDHLVLTYVTTVTNVAAQPVYVAMPTGSYNGYYQAWLHESWRRLEPGQSTKFVQHLSSAVLGGEETLMLVRPSIPPKGAADYTVWVNDTSNIFTQFGAASPSGACTGIIKGNSAGIASAPNGGYWVSSNYGQVSPCGADNFNNYGATTGPYIFSDPAGNGYWLANSWGQVDAYGSARWYGQYNKETDITGAVATVSGEGYWLASADGTVFRYGDAPYYGSAHIKNGFIHTTDDAIGEYTTAPTGIVGIAPTEGDHGYVLVARNGAVYGFGKGRGGACSPIALPKGVSVAGVAPDYRTGGYWVAETDGTVVACHAPSYPYKAVQGTVMGIGALGNGLGYRLVTAGGRVYDYGAATWRGNPN